LKNKENRLTSQIKFVFELVMALRYLLTLGDRYAPVLRSSKFKEEGKLTPDEFVVAGEQLVHTCGTWVWYGSSIRVDCVSSEGKPQGGWRYCPCS
jgi:ubiquitin-like-conjugating enzyme ATG3